MCQKRVSRKKEEGKGRNHKGDRIIAIESISEEG